MNSYLLEEIIESLDACETEKEREAEADAWAFAIANSFEEEAE